MSNDTIVECRANKGHCGGFCNGGSNAKPSSHQNMMASAKLPFVIKLFTLTGTIYFMLQIVNLCMN